MKEFILDGNKFSDLDGFYTEIGNLLTDNKSWKIGHNLDAFNDLLRGGFGMHEYEEELVIKWINYNKSKKDLGNETVLTLLEIFLNFDNSGHSCKVELFH